MSDSRQFSKKRRAKGFSRVAPELTEGLFEKVGRVQALVGGEKFLQGLPPLRLQVLPVGEQGVFLPLDEPPVVAGHARVFALADLVERITEVPQDVELVEEDLRVGGIPARRVATRRTPSLGRGRFEGLRLPS